VQNGLTLEQVVSTVHAHPTLPEGFLEAAENALGCGIHTARRRPPATDGSAGS
jgi:dihydrolipoamide dehydrogenase